LVNENTRIYSKNQSAAFAMMVFCIQNSTTTANLMNANYISKQQNGGNVSYLRLETFFKKIFVINMRLQTLFITFSNVRYNQCRR